MSHLENGVDYVKTVMLHLFAWLVEVFNVIDGFETLMLVLFAMFCTVRFLLMPLAGALGLPAGPGLGAGSDGVRKDVKEIKMDQKYLGSGD